MKKLLIVLIIFISNLFGNIIELSSNNLEILSQSKIYIDNTRKLNIDEIIKNDKNFINANSSIKNYGYSPEFDVWIKFTLHNKKDEPITKILEFSNSLVTNISFYEDTKLIKNEGLLNKDINRKSVNPIFSINLDKNETKTYYMEVFSKKTSLTLKLNLYSYDDFYSKEIFHQIILSLFFGAMIILALYNLSLFFMIKDISYFYYVAYIATLVLWRGNINSYSELKDSKLK